jgi:hypothetical protein
MNDGNCDQAMITVDGANYYSAIGVGNAVTRNEYPIAPMTINGTSYELITINIGASSYSCVATIDLVINGGSPHRYTNYGSTYTVHTGDRIEAHLSGGTCDEFSIWIDGVDTGLTDYLNTSATQNIIIQGKGTEPLQIDFGSTDTNCTSVIGLYVNDIFIVQYSGTYGGTHWAKSGDKVEAYLSGGTCYESSIWVNGVDSSSNHYKSSQLISTYISLQGIGKSLVPTVTTNTIGNILYTTASGGGNVTSQGSASVTARGICWSTTSNPTLANSHTTDYYGVGTFTSSMTGLTVNTLYYVRAYATNAVGTGYGDQETFNTLAATTTTTTLAPTTTTTTTTTYPNFLVFDAWVNGPTTWSPVGVVNSGDVLHWDAYLGTELYASADANDPTFTFPEEISYYVSFNITSTDQYIGLTQLDLQQSDVGIADISAAQSLTYFNVHYCGLDENQVIGVLDVLIGYGKINGYLNVADQSPAISYSSTTLAKFAILTARGWTVFY